KVILNDILQISSEVDEMVFELPITATERASIKHSDIADLVNHCTIVGIINPVGPFGPLYEALLVVAGPAISK
ncbi:hypothetical protein IDG68_14935, partial [Staphylococcus sp. EG-SA-21]|nr:hypothetical protein [Staphylococcus sp. EG-SA-21]